jgi:hypothetical protein
MKNLACLLGLILGACTTAPAPPQAPAELKAASNYRAIISKHSQYFRKYDGFYEVFRGHATLLTPECRDAILNQQATYLSWDSQKKQAERERNSQDMSSQTQVFMQLYTPEVEYNDLGKYNSIWKIYLIVDGHRFEGKAKKMHGKPIEFESIYPDYDSFSRPYLLTFNIATSDVIRHDAKLVLASTLGTAEYNFPAGP